MGVDGRLNSSGWAMCLVAEGGDWFVVNDGHTTASGRIDSRLDSSGWAMCLVAEGGD